eukprot:SAG22_NODE_962_length_6280_cov_4.343472_4_plen_62_part_00
MNDYFHGLQFADNKDYATMVCTDPQLCYDVVPNSIVGDEELYEPKGSADKSVEWIDRDRVD